MARARSPAKLWEVSACDPSRSEIIRPAAAHKRAAFGMTGTCPATEYGEVRSRDPRRSTIARWTAACKRSAFGVAGACSAAELRKIGSCDPRNSTVGQLLRKAL